MKSGVCFINAYWLCTIATVHLLTLFDSLADFVLATIVQPALPCWSKNGKWRDGMFCN